MRRDRRSIPANERVVHVSLAAQPAGRRVTEGERRRIRLPVVDLCAAPGGPRDKQMLFGHAFRLLEAREGWGFGFDEGDGYVGWLPLDALAPDVTPTHRVRARATHLYTAPDIKASEREALSFASELAVEGEEGAFCAISGGGFVPRAHLEPLAARAEDPIAIAEMFLGTPYLWGGNSAFGIDCSGLVQLALRAAGQPCPRDSDQQEETVGRAIETREDLRGGDLVFWKGHVGMMADEATLIHANAHHMAVVREPLAEARARIVAAGGGPVTSCRRP